MRTLDVPGEPGQRVTIRRLSPTALRANLAAYALQGIEALRARGDFETELRSALEAHGGETAVRAQGAADPVISYDAAKLIERSVLEWLPPRATPAPGSELELWLAREILGLSKIGGGT